MFDIDLPSSIRTAGVYLLYRNKFAFMIGPNKNGDKLGIVRLGGHLEENEGIIDCVKREVREEASVDINVVSSLITYYKSSWEEESYEVKDKKIFDINPILVVGDKTRATALYLAYTEKQMVPAAEAHGIILLNEKEIVKICSEQLTLADFVNSGGDLLQSQKMNFALELNSGPHLRVLSRLMDTDGELIRRFMNRTL